MSDKATDTFKIPSVKNSSRSDSFVMVFLDALLDTRIGVIGEANPELASKILSSGQYSKRKFDGWDELSGEEFKKLYAARDVDTLPHCIVTNVSFFLQRLVKDAMAADAMAPNDDKLVVHLNVWPYTGFTQGELDSLRDVVRFYTYSYAEVVVMSKSIKDLTPAHCKDNYDIIIMYDYELFIETHVSALEKLQIPGVSLVAPAMYRNQLPVGEDAEAISKLQMNPFRAMEVAMTPVVGLKLMPVSLFCITDQINHDNKEDVLNSIRYTEDYLSEIITTDSGKIDKFDMDNTPVISDVVVNDEDDLI